MKFKAACIQISSQNNMDANIEKASSFIKEAANAGADFIALPENVAFMAANGEELMANIYSVSDHPALQAFRQLAANLKRWILIGSLATKVQHSDKIANRSFLINDKGEVVTHYDKIHLYDASVRGGETHKESKRYIAGDKAVIADTPWCKIGMTICYDLRFPHLYRKLATSGSALITAPSAFTKYTGEAHWHVLLRARAIENSCYIIAPAQTGNHPSDRQTYGHSLIVNPWGEIIAEATEDEGVIMADINMDEVDKVRKQIPSLEHDRDFV